jgi:hypothetical protein
MMSESGLALSSLTTHFLTSTRSFHLIVRVLTFSTPQYLQLQPVYMFITSVRQFRDKLMRILEHSVTGRTLNQSLT